MHGNLRPGSVFLQRRNSDAHAMAVAFSRWNLERHATKTLRARRKVNEIVVGFVHPTCNTINPLACVAICLCAQIKRNKFSSRTLKCFTPEDSREKVPMPFGNLMHALQNVRAVFFVPMLEAAARQFARRACQHTTVDVVPDALLAAESL